MKNFRKNKGITLVALIITVIILLILAGIAIASLTGENGLITRAQQAKTETEEASDIEQISILINENQIKEHILGEKLKKVEFNITENTKSIYDLETGTTYGEGWYYLTPENANELQLHKSYIVNYQNGEIVKFDENKHRMITNELKCITDGLVYAADPQNMTDGNSWGDATLHNFNEGDENSGWSQNALMFDGIDDGIEVEDKSDYSNGITLEMYFSLRGQTENQNVQILMMKRNTAQDGFFIFLGNLSNEDNTDFEYRRISIDIGGCGDRVERENRFKTGLLVEENKPIYITYTFNPNLENDKGILYVNGEKRETTNLGNIDNLIKVQEDTNIQIGSDIYETEADFKYPFNGEIYAARVYNRPLTEQEVEYNYNATVNE